MACLIRLLDQGGTTYFDFFIREDSTKPLPNLIKKIKTDETKTVVTLQKNPVEYYHHIDGNKKISEIIFPWEDSKFSLDSEKPIALIYLKNQICYESIPITSMTITHMTASELSVVENYHNQNKNLSI